jgi:hypothetical protein
MRTPLEGAAGLFGRLHAQGLLDAEDIRAALARTPDRDARIRAAHTARDSHWFWRARRAAAAAAIRAEIEPLLAARLAAAAIRAAAARAADESLLPHEPDAIAADAAQRHLRRHG